MKNNLVYLFTLLLAVTFTSCDETPVVFDNINGQVAVKFIQTAYPNTTVSAGGATVTLPVSVTTLASADRTFKAVADPKSTGPAASYSIGDVTIPAGSYTGSMVEIRLFIIVFGAQLQGSSSGDAKSTQDH